MVRDAASTSAARCLETPQAMEQRLVLNAESTIATLVLETPRATELRLSCRNAVSTQAAHASESPNTTRARLTSNASLRHEVRDNETNKLSQVRRERRFQSDLSTLSRINLNVEDGTIHPSPTDCLHSALNGLPGILLHRKSTF